MRGGPDVSFGEVWNILASLAVRRRWLRQASGCRSFFLSPSILGNDNVFYHVRRAPMFSGVHRPKAGSQRSRRPREFGNVVPGGYTPVLAKRSKHFSLDDSLAIGVMQRNFGPLKHQVEGFQTVQFRSC